MPTTLNSGLQLPDKGSVDWYSSMQNNYNLLDNHLENNDTHVTAEDKANWNSKQGSLSQAQLDAIAQVATNTSDIATLQSGKANASHTHSSSDITDIGDYATKQYVDTSISGLVDNAPAALDTLKELSTALNDDANFASTVTNALSAKANSADLATVATSGSYNDLSNKPTINDSTITIQKNGSLVGTFTVNGSAKTIDIPVPAKTSDLTNDSNFVDTSNSAVASGITSAKVTSYDAHIADTDIHVTTADKTKWNNGVSQAYVFRYSSTALVASSTNSNTLLDNTDNLKVGDKVIDSDGVLFSITAIDTANSTFTVGSALTDLALDANVVHTSGNETVGGAKTFSDNLTIYNSDDTQTPKGLTIRNAQWIMGESGGTTTINIQFLDKNSNVPASIIASKGIYGQSFLRFSVRTKNSQNTIYSEEIYYNVDTSGKVEFRSWHDNIISLGTSAYRWKSVYATNYYYGANNVEFSTKFVTSDTAQTITETKTFTNTIKSQKEIELTGSRLAYILPEFSASYSGLSLCTYGSSGAVKLGTWKVDDNDNTKHVLDTSLGFLNVTIGSVNGVNSVFITPRNTTDSKLGDSTNKWKSINGLTPSSLSLPVAPSATSYVDISGYLTVLDSSSANTYTPPSNGYITFSVTGNLVQIFHDYGLQGKWTVQAGNANRGFIPVLGGVEVKIYLTASSVDKFWFIPCQGNI